MLLADNDNNIYQDMILDATDVAVTDAVLTGKIYDPLGALMETVSFSYLGNGTYYGTSTFSVTVGVTYKIVIKASNYNFSSVKYETGKEAVRS